MKNKQTVVEFLEKAFYDPYKNRPFIQTDEWEEAKQLFRQQIINAFDLGFSSGYGDAQGDGTTFEDGTQYYNETYGKL